MIKSDPHIAEDGAIGFTGEVTFLCQEEEKWVGEAETYLGEKWENHRVGWSHMLQKCDWKGKVEMSW